MTTYREAHPLCRCDTIGSACPDPECQQRYNQIGMSTANSKGEMGEPTCNVCGSYLQVYRYYTGLEVWDIREAESPDDGFLWVRVDGQVDSDEYLEEIRVIVKCAGCGRQIAKGAEIEVQYG